LVDAVGGNAVVSVGAVAKVCLGSGQAPGRREQGDRQSTSARPPSWPNWCST